MDLFPDCPIGFPKSTSEPKELEMVLPSTSSRRMESPSQLKRATLSTSPYTPLSRNLPFLPRACFSHRSLLNPLAKKYSDPKKQDTVAELLTTTHQDLEWVAVEHGAGSGAGMN